MPDKGTLLIFGATRGVGLELARHARAQGRAVTAFVRPGSTVEALQAIGATLLRGDALSSEDVARAIAGTPGDIDIVSTLGGRAQDGRRADDEGNINVVRTAVDSGRTRRVVLITSIGCGEMAPFRSARAISAFGAAVDAKTRAEDALRRSGLDWTILRPGGLISEPATGKAILSTDPEMHGIVHREDVALMTLRTLRDPATVGHAFAIVDSGRMQCANPVQPFPLSA